jgi:DsbC/DsbD-like thiol-disulfide interchange protein
MMRQTNLILISCALALVMVACGGNKSDNANAPSAPAQSSTSEITSSASVVSVNVAAAGAAAGGTAEVVVKLTIKNGYHVNANPPSMAYLIPTELSIEPSTGITAGKPVYPSSITKKFAFSETPLAVYENEAAIKMPLEIAKTATAGERDLKAKLRVQACDDKACYKPSTIETSIPVTVR